MKLHALAVAAVLALANAPAQASTYAVSYNTISNFGLTFSGPGTLYPFTFSTSVAAQGVLSDTNFGTNDAPAACVGTFCSAFNNSFAAHGSGSDYAYGDALIGSGNVLAGTGSASSIGEISAGPAGFASGSNSMVASFLLSAPGTVSFAFNALPYMQVAGAGNAFTTMTIAISDALGHQVFSWAPDGVTGSGITGGTETSDSHNLNFGIASGVTYNPSAGSFAATTGSLAGGAYTLNISMTNQVTAVPEPETWAMLLVGVGLVALRARRKVQSESI